MDRLEIRERSTQAISRDLYRRLDESDEFWQLVSAGIVTLQRTRDIPYGIRAGSFVGQALVSPDLLLVVREKSTGALQALLNWAVPADFRDAPLLAPVAQDSPVLETFARRFLSHLGYYLRHGRAKEYLLQREVSSVVRGRIDFEQTMRLFSRGGIQKIAQTRKQLSGNTLPNQLLSLGIRAVDALAKAGIGREDIAELAQTYAPLFEDVDQSLLRREWILRAAAFERAMQDTRVAGELRKALAYGRALALNLGIWPDESSSAEVPRSFFLSLETLFEEAVRQVLIDSSRGVLDVKRGFELRQPLLREQIDRYLADPDFVVFQRQQRRLVGDCKYKEVGTAPDHADVYQLIAHCTAFEVKRSLLVYPGDALSVARLGETLDGIEIMWATVRPNSLAQDVTSLLQQLELLVVPAQAAG